MNRQVSFAYAIAGLAVAVALIAAIGSSSRLFPRDNHGPAIFDSRSSAAAPELGVPANLPASAPLEAPDLGSSAVLALGDGQATDDPEIFYVDAPARGDHKRAKHRGRHDDDHERAKRHGDHERAKHHGHHDEEEDDDD